MYKVTQFADDTRLNLNEQKTPNIVFTLRPLDTEIIHVKFLGRREIYAQKILLNNVF